jgi:hypothetical protein
MPQFKPLVNEFKKAMFGYMDFIFVNVNLMKKMKRKRKI